MLWGLLRWPASLSILNPVPTLYKRIGTMTTTAWGECFAAGIEHIHSEPYPTLAYWAYVHYSLLLLPLNIILSHHIDIAYIRTF